MENIFILIRYTYYFQPKKEKKLDTTVYTVIILHIQLPHLFLSESSARLKVAWAPSKQKVRVGGGPTLSNYNLCRFVPTKDRHSLAHRVYFGASFIFMVTRNTV